MFKLPIIPPRPDGFSTSKQTTETSKDHARSTYKKRFELCLKKRNTTQVEATYLKATPARLPKQTLNLEAIMA
jgi:hypothetical protein